MNNALITVDEVVQDLDRRIIERLRQQRRQSVIAERKVLAGQIRELKELRQWIVGTFGTLGDN